MDCASEMLTNEQRKALEGSVCAFGVFDGLHKGHAYIIQKAIDEATKRSTKPVVITFSIDPDDIFSKGTHVKLSSDEERISRINNMLKDVSGEVVVLDFNEQLSKMMPEDFLDAMFAENVPLSIHVGNDFHFGSKAAGTVETLSEWGKIHGMDVYPHGLLESDGTPITSTRIRTLLAEGRVEEANQLLGYSYSLL